ncbi:MAG: hypothetical protein ABI396_15490 [Ktedonobacteraceae bacterium]
MISPIAPDPCTSSPRYNTTPHAHQTLLVVAPPDRVVPRGMSGHPRARKFPLERPLLLATKAFGILRSGDEHPRDLLIRVLVFVS